jgi:hypothetical protein
MLVNSVSDKQWPRHAVLAVNKAPFLDKGMGESTQEHSDLPPRRLSSSGGGTENMDYLMNRYRVDTGSHSSANQEQVVMEHAMGILRAAGMHVDTGRQVAG